MSVLEKRIDALESTKATGKPAYVLAWDDDDQETKDRAIARCRSEHPDASEIVVLVWRRPEP